MEQLFEKKEMKFLLLKAILLGIQYGKSDKSEEYKDSVMREIQKLSDSNKINTSHQIPSQPPRKNINNIQKETVHFQTIQEKKNEVIIVKSPIVERLEMQLNFLETERMKIYHFIQYLSNTNYTYNYAKIQYLYNQYATVQEEIDKKRVNIEKEKKNDIVRQNEKKYKSITPQPSFQQITQLRHEEHKKRFNEQEETFIQNAKQVIEEKQEQSDDQTLKTLEKTLQSLSSIFMND